MRYRRRVQAAFVTGGTGFLGLNLVALLREQGVRVVAVHRKGSDTRRLVELGAELVQSELDDGGALAAAMPDEVDAVFHMAGDLSWWKLHEKEQERVNVGGTRNVVQAALTRRAKRFIHTSSVAAYGLGHAVVTERTPSTAARSPIGYVRTKWLGEREVDQGIARGLSAVILNPANIMGAYDTRSWARLFFLLRDRKLPGVPPGSASYCHAREVVKSLVEAVTRRRTGERYLLGGTDATYAEVAVIMGELLGVEPPRPVPALVLKTLGQINEWVSHVTRKEPDVTRGNAELVCSRWSVDPSKAEKELGFRRVPLRQMIEDSFQWLKREKLL
jgi:nucleoside-diphosphate-sugar epimerase